MKSDLDTTCRDALGEAGNVGAGFAARAMERLLGEGSRLSPPRVGGGVAYVYRLEDGDWVEQARLTPPGGSDPYLQFAAAIIGALDSDRCQRIETASTPAELHAVLTEPVR